MGRNKMWKSMCEVAGEIRGGYSVTRGKWGMKGHKDEKIPGGEKVIDADLRNTENKITQV